MKNVLLLTNKPYFGGAERQIVLLANGLVSKGYSVTLYYLKEGNAYINDVDNRVNVVRPLGTEGNISSILKLSKHLHKENPDVVISFLYHSTLIARALKLLKDYKHISAIRNTSYGSPFRDWVFKITSFLDNHTTANSSLSLNTLCNNKKRNTFIPNIVSFEQLGENKNICDKKTYCFIGRLTHQKNLINLIKAFVKFRTTKDGNASLVIVGDGKQRVYIKDLINSHKASEYISMTGTVEDPTPILSAADFLVLPSLREGMPNVVTEAIQCKVPVIVTEVGSIPDLLEKNISAIFIEGTTEDDILESLHVSFSMTLSAKQEMASKALEVIYRKCSKDQVLNLWVNVIERV